MLKAADYNTFQHLLMRGVVSYAGDNGSDLKKKWKRLLSLGFVVYSFRWKVTQFVSYTIFLSISSIKLRKLPQWALLLLIILSADRGVSRNVGWYPRVFPFRRAT